MSAGNWLLGAVNNVPQPSRVLAVAAQLVRVAVALGVVFAAGVALALMLRVFLWGWGLGW